MIRLQDASKRYRHKEGEVVALQATTLELRPGEFVAVIGPSGSGKTTLLSMLGGMLAPSNGKVWLNDQSLYDATVSQRGACANKSLVSCFRPSI